MDKYLDNVVKERPLILSTGAQHPMVLQPCRGHRVQGIKACPWGVTVNAFLVAPLKWIRILLKLNTLHAKFFQSKVSMLVLENEIHKIVSIFTWNSNFVGYTAHINLGVFFIWKGKVKEYWLYSQESSLIMPSLSLLASSFVSSSLFLWQKS